MKHKKPNDTLRKKTSTSGKTGDDEVAKQMQRYSMQLAKLFKELGELPAVTGQPSRAEQKRAEARKADIAAQVRRLQTEMNELRERTGSWKVKEQPREADTAALLRKEAEEEKLRLRKRLGKIADAQVALVAAWNSDPSEAKKADFQREYRQLSDDYASVRAELNRVREGIRKL